MENVIIIKVAKFAKAQRIQGTRFFKPINEARSKLNFVFFL